MNVQLPEGPITIKRFNPYKSQPEISADTQTISPQMLWRVAGAIQPGTPLNIDRILGASYNTRSALEALLAHTPEFYMCHPGRVETTESTTDVKKGHKHLLWCPDTPHAPGNIVWKDTEITVVELPSQDVIYDSLTNYRDAGLEPMERRHSQIQVALALIGNHLGYKTWIARQDRGIVYNAQQIGEMQGVISDLSLETLISPVADAVKIAKDIDVIWFQNAKYMPAVIEVEHTTGVTSGLTRMKKLRDAIPAFTTNYIVAAPDELRDKVMVEANQAQFQDLHTRFFPYTAIEELLALLNRRNLNSLGNEFLNAFTEPALA
jgi:type II restriction enzyme